MKSLIEKLDDWLRTNRPSYYQKLLPGLASGELNAFQQRFQLVLPDGFIQLYEWKNGQPSDCFDSFQFNWMFNSLGEIADTKKLLDGMIGTDFDDPTWWRRGWIPFLSNGGGDHLCLDVDAEDGGQKGQLLEFWHDDDLRTVEFASVDIWLKDIVTSMANGTYEIS